MADMFMPQPLPAVNGTGMQQMLPFIPPDQIAQNQADMLQWQQRQALAQQLMGAQYQPDSGKVGLGGTILTKLMGALAQRGQNEKLTDLLKQQFAIENQASQAKRQQELEDEYRKMQEDIYKGTQIARGSKQAERDFALPEVTNGLMIDRTTGEAKPIAGWNDAALSLAKQKAAIEAANRQGPADPFREIKTALSQGVITQDEALKRMHDVALGMKDNVNIPTGYRPTQDGKLEAIPGGPADPATQMNKPQPVSAENRTKLGLLDAAQSALDNYKVQGVDARGNPHPFANAFTPGNTANTSAEEAIANILRVESGAAISAGEISSAKDRYMPSSLRSDAENRNRLEMLQKKIEAQRSAILQGTNEAPGASKSPGAPEGGHKVGDVITVHGKQYRVVGGDPTDPNLAPL